MLEGRGGKEASAWGRGVEFETTEGSQADLVVLRCTSSNWKHLKLSLLISTISPPICSCSLVGLICIRGDLDRLYEVVLVLDLVYNEDEDGE